MQIEGNMAAANQLPGQYCWKRATGSGGSSAARGNLRKCSNSPACQRDRLSAC